jgi:hypothetical protein
MNYEFGSTESGDEGGRLTKAAANGFGAVAFKNALALARPSEPMDVGPPGTKIADQVAPKKAGAAGDEHARTSKVALVG